MNDPQVARMTSSAGGAGSTVTGWTFPNYPPQNPLREYKLKIMQHMEWSVTTDEPQVAGRSRYHDMTAAEAAAFVNEMAAALVKHDEEQMKGTT